MCMLWYVMRCVFIDLHMHIKWALPKLCKNICIRGQSMVASNMYCGVLEASVGPKFFVVGPLCPKVCKIMCIGGQPLNCSKYVLCVSVQSI